MRVRIAPEGCAQSRHALLLVCHLALLCFGSVALAGVTSVSQEDAVALFPEALASHEFVISGEPSNDTALFARTAAIVRLAGAGFLPFGPEKQQAVVASFIKEAVQAGVPIEMVSYREDYPDPAAPNNATGTAPYVDLAFNSYVPIIAANGTAAAGAGANFSEAERAAGQQQLGAWLRWRSGVLTAGNWSVPEHSVRLQLWDTNADPTPTPLILHPLIVLEAALAVNASWTYSKGELAAEQASVVAGSLQGAILRRQGTLVEVASRDRATIEATLDASIAVPGGDTMLLLLEVTMYTCLGEAAAPDASCERRILDRVLGELVGSAEVKQQWQAASVFGVSVLQTRARPLPLDPSTTSSNSSAPSTWVPWHLDRIDQRSPVLDGKYTASVAGTGVNVYLLSSGVRADHEEFKYMDGRPGSRIRAAWGFQGQDPLQDCSDAGFWYGFGTMAASLIGGVTVGVAKNTTIYSVRYRKSCYFEEASDSKQPVWSTGRLPSALDAVLSTHQHPAMIVVDTWWSPKRSSVDNDAGVVDEIRMRLDAAYAANITVFAPAGFDSATTPPCEGLFADHPTVIMVSTTDEHDQRTVFGASNSTCIDLYAPGGGMGMALTGASSASPSEYTSLALRSFGATWLAAGVGAQYLSVNPTATPDEVHAALLDSATPHVVTGAGPQSTTRLLYTAYGQAGDETPTPGLDNGSVVMAPAPSSVDGSSSGGSNTGVIIGAVVAAVVVVAVAAAVAMYLIARRRRATSGGLEAAILPKDVAGPESGMKQPGHSCPPGGSTGSSVGQNGLMAIGDVADAGMLGAQRPASKPAPNPFWAPAPAPNPFGAPAPAPNPFGAPPPAPNPFFVPAPQVSTAELVRQAKVQQQERGLSSSSGVPLPSSSLGTDSTSCAYGSDSMRTPMATEAPAAAYSPFVTSNDGSSGDLPSSSGATGSQQSHGVEELVVPALLSGGPHNEWELDARRLQLCTSDDGRLVVLGAGSFGTVYRGMLDGGTAVAVKVLQPDTQRSVRSLRNEVEIMKACRDPRIVQFFGACFHTEWVMLVTEFLEGGALARSISLPELRWHNRGREVALGIVAGLCYMHANHLVHLDLKSANILLTADGLAKIADMGLSRVLSKEYLTQSSALGGTFAWAAPEVILGQRCTSKADIYSLGVVLWEIITGDVPLRGLLRQVQCPKECPQVVADLIDACMEADPHKRPTAEEVHAMLQEVE